MLLFIFEPVLTMINEYKFKYILCCYLSVSLSPFPCAFEIQIHLMLLFIKEQEFLMENITEFKYILCCYLSPYPAGNANSFNNSNTSYVVIYLTSLTTYTKSAPYSNTSYVVIYPITAANWDEYLANSNTSYVVIYHGGNSYFLREIRIQIHLMLLFISAAGFRYSRSWLIQIHLMLLFITIV